MNINLDDLANQIVADGVAAHDDDLFRIAQQLRLRGWGGTIANLLTDPLAPAIVRQRAFGIAAGYLATAAPAAWPAAA